MLTGNKRTDENDQVDKIENTDHFPVWWYHHLSI